MRYWIALFLIVPHTVLTAQETDTRPAVHIKGVSRVNASYYRGAEPSRQGYERLASLGIRTVIDLKQEGIAEEASIVQAIYRMTHDDWTAEQAFGEMRRHGYNNKLPGVLTDHGALKDFVFDYARRHAPQSQ